MRAAMISMILLGSSLFSTGCSEKRIMPQKPADAMTYHMEVEYDLDFTQPEIPDKDSIWKMDFRLTVSEVHRDDSLSFAMEFLDVQYGTDDGGFTTHPLTGRQLVVRCFPWGELLVVEGFQSVSVLEDVQWLDFIFGAVFPNPPRRSGQQWQNRLLPWPFYLNPESHSKQIVAATWSQPEKQKWEYDGTWYGKRGVTPLFDGTANGQIEANSPWVQSHSFEWTRHVTVPLNVSQQVVGKLERVQ